MRMSGSIFLFAKGPCSVDARTCVAVFVALAALWHSSQDTPAITKPILLHAAVKVDMLVRVLFSFEPRLCHQLL